MSLPKTAIVIPCFNEARRLDLNRFKAAAAGNRGLRFILVNDGSTDATLDLLRQLQHQSPIQFEVINLESNCGKAEAVRQGFLRGFERSASYVGFWDADLATPLEAIPEFVSVLDSRPDIDLVIGSRMQLLGREIQRHFLRQKIGNVCAAMASLTIGNRIQDSQCGSKLFRVTPVTRHAFRQCLNSRWLFDVELFARLIRAWKMTGERPFASRVFEYPLQRWDEIPGSSLRKLDFVRAAVELWNIYWRYRGPFAKASGPAEIIAGTTFQNTVLPVNNRVA